jgi:siroheme synthase
MGVGQAAAIAAALIAAGKPAATPLAVVENASLPNARTIYSTIAALPRIAEADLTGPAVILIGAQFRAHHAVAGNVLADIATEASDRRESDDPGRVRTGR